MSEHRILSNFCKCGDWHHLSRKFKNLTSAAQRIALSLIQGGDDPAKAIRKAKKAVSYAN